MVLRDRNHLMIANMVVLHCIKGGGPALTHDGDNESDIILHLTVVKTFTYTHTF